MQTVRNLLRLKRNLTLALVVIITASNILLAIKLYTAQQVIILVPTIDRQLKVGSNFVSKDYLKLRAEQIVYLLFSMKNENLDQVMPDLLKQVDNSSHKEFKTQLEKLGNDIKARGYYYSFADLKGWDVNEADLTVQVSGYLETYLSGRQIDRQLKKYKLAFYNKGGLVNLNTFEEIKLEGDHESNN
jgi:type IV conjugative transfer system protein TraE